MATVPFPIGEYRPGDSFGVDGLPCRLTPFGAEWPDGSFRFAQLHVPLDLAAGEEVVVELSRLSQVPHSFQYSSWVSHAMSQLSIKVVVVLPGSQLAVAEPTRIRTLVDSGVHRTHYLRARVPQTDLVVDLWYTELSGQDHMPFELRLTNSDTTSARLKQPIESAHLWVEGAAAHIRGYKRRGASYGPLSAAGPNVVHLLGQTDIYDGQGQEWLGDLLFWDPAERDPVREETLMATVAYPLFGVSTDWARSGAFGPFGFVPPPPPWITDGGRSAALARRQQFDSWKKQRGGPWDDLPLGLHKFPGMTGAQPDFGAAKLVEIFASGMPDGIEEARFNASEEAARPVHHREPDGSPLQRVNHPQWVAGGGRTHWHPLTSPDRLGKPVPEPPVDAHGWLGRDGQHWSSLTLASAYLLTGSPSLRYELDNESELYMAEFTLPSVTPGKSTNQLGAARGVGRSLLSMAWNYVCTGNDVLRGWMGERVRQVVQAQAVGTTVTGPVRPLYLAPPDPRQLLRTSWRTWEEAQAVMGLEAAALATGCQEAHQLAVMVAKTVVEHGWRVRSPSTEGATAVGWKNNGEPLTAAELNDPTWVMWYSGFNEWSVPCVKLALRFATTSGDPALAARAQTILQDVAAGRRPPSNGGWDPFADWEAAQ